MTDLSVAEELVLQLMGVEGEDRLLPLQVLINMNRRALRAPLEKLSTLNTETGQLGSVAAPKIWSEDQKYIQASATDDWVGDRWHALSDGKILRNHEPLTSLSIEIHDETGWNSLEDEALLKLAGSPSQLAGTLILKASDSWTAYDPLYALHQLTWPGAKTEALLALLDVELQLDPAFLELIEAFSGA